MERLVTDTSGNAYGEHATELVTWREPNDEALCAKGMAEK